MRTFSKRTLVLFWQRNATAQKPLSEWFDWCEEARWTNFADLKATFAAADQVGNKVIFNIGGNSYRLIARVNYQHHGVLVRWLGTHAEYDRLTGKEISEL